MNVCVSLICMLPGGVAGFHSFNCELTPPVVFGVMEERSIQATHKHE